MSIAVSPLTPIAEGKVRFGSIWPESRWVIEAPWHQFDQAGNRVAYHIGKTAEFHDGYLETDDPVVIAFLRSRLGSVIFEVNPGEMEIPVPKVEVGTSLHTASTKTETKQRCTACGKVLHAGQMAFHLRSHAKQVKEPEAVSPPT